MEYVRRFPNHKGLYPCTKAKGCEFKKRNGRCSLQFIRLLGNDCVDFVDRKEFRDFGLPANALQRLMQAVCPLCGKSSSDGKEHEECMDREAALADREEES